MEFSEKKFQIGSRKFFFSNKRTPINTINLNLDFMGVSL